MARMVQDFSLRYPLVDGQGNFGSMDGDSPAAMRYTEARLAKIAEELLLDIDSDTVDFNDNYDGTQQEPAVLPARLPNMLLNGASGIAVGMATNIPPHNLRELAGAIVYLIERYDQIDDVTVDELIEFVKGPDFPTGAEILAGDELKEAYATGRGRVVMRAKSDIEEGKNGRFRLVFSEIPYQVSKIAVIERIVQLVKDDRLNQIADLRDESDREGTRLIVELKNGAQPNKVLNQLYKYTQLQSTYSIQMLALVDGEPRTLSLKRMLHIYIDHRYEVIRRRSEYELGKRRARAHILEGLLKALSSLDAIIQTIRSADSVEQARERLMTRFDLSEAQANAILEMQLRRLAALEQQKLNDEFSEVMARIAYLEDLIASPYKILDLIRADVNELAADFGDERRTTVKYGISVDFSEADFVRDEEVIILLTNKGYVKRVPSSAYRSQRRGGRGVIGMTTRDEDGLQEIVAANSLDTILFFTDKGKVYSERAFAIPEAGRASKGSLMHMVLNLQPDERVTGIVPVDSFDKDGYFILATREGKIKRVHLDEFEGVRPSGLIAMNLDDGDTLNWACYTDGDQDVVIATASGQSIRFHEKHVRVMGRQAGGVNAMKLGEGDRLIGMDVITADDTHVLVVTTNGYGKRTPIEDYRVQGRYGSGIRTLTRDERTGAIIAMRCINPTDDILLITGNAIVMRTSLEQIRETGRSALGVRMMKLEKGDTIRSIAIMAGLPGEAEIETTDGDISAENDGVDSDIGDASLDDAAS
jgi:DNA gyrase subunit A